MKIYNYLILLIFLQSSFAVAQIGIGTKKPDESSVLDIDSKAKGLLIPRMSSNERDLIKNPATALIIYNSTLQAIEINIGTKSTPIWILVGDNGAVSSSNKLSSGAIFVGDNVGNAKEVQVSGEAIITNSGVITLKNDAVISKTLTAYKSGAGKITPNDNIIQAIQKLDGNQSTNAVITVSTDYNLLLTDYTILCDNETKPFAINLPEVSSCRGKVYVINKIDETSNVLNINPPIQLTKKVAISQLNYPKSFKIQSDGKVWFIIN
ncbi:hypothetical protein [Flavobacterium cellulosilyticum]|uniref:Uncharacterized protein n=1 Tax=Flavobacterium cellulosilyticum TaxID=2541731 RepID=A0A4R5C802_9FLAO|nr:hypothetical protein [Flavobacterium cellulosilyticum]TDD95898.1 hypothetical protein E0F76_12365 [Flavobacterium cellulosilyticum]